MPDHPAPCSWIARFAPLVAPRAQLLDLACGQGRHARLFLAQGCRVSALDRDLGGVADLAHQAELIAADLENGAWPLGARQFDAIVVSNYLHRPLFPALCAALAEGGILVYETFMQGNAAFGRPSNPDFLLAPGELLHRCCGPLTPLAFEQGVVARAEGGQKMVQRLCARRGPADLPLP